MTEQANAGLAESEPAGANLDSIIESAIETVEAQAEPPADGASSEPKADKAGRLHGERGKFVPKTDSAAVASGKEQANAAKAADKNGLQPAEVQPVEAPHTWSADDKAKFATLTPEAKEFVVGRYKAMEADYTRKTQETADFRRSAEPLLNAIKPYENYLTQLGPVTGQQAPQLIAGLLSVEYRLRTGSAQEKVQALANICGTYGIDLAALARGEVAQPNHEFQQVRHELSELRNWKTQFEQNAEQQQVQQTSLHIESFATAKDEAGRPRYPHFERVRGVMAQALLSGEAKTLEEAYTNATAPIQEAIAEELSKRQTQADTQRKEAVARADRAAPVRSSGSQPGGSAKGGDLDSILGAAITKAGIA